MNKQDLIEAREAFGHLCDAFDAFLLSDADEEPLAMVTLLANMTSAEPTHLHRLADAARERERLLPGECEHGSTEPHKLAYGSDERYCDGQVWDEGIVEAVAKAVGEDFLYLDPNNEGNWMGPGEQAARQVAIVALSALVELLTEKVET